MPGILLIIQPVSYFLFYLLKTYSRHLQTASLLKINHPSLLSDLVNQSMGCFGLAMRFL